MGGCRPRAEAEMNGYQVGDEWDSERDFVVHGSCDDWVGVGMYNMQYSTTKTRYSAMSVSIQFVSWGVVVIRFDSGLVEGL
jgi:hypothetical protein